MAPASRIVGVCAQGCKLQKECRAGDGIAVAGWRRFPRDEPDDPDFSVGFAANGQSRDRTGDLRIFSPSLYQLSYLSPWELSQLNIPLTPAYSSVSRLAV